MNDFFFKINLPASDYLIGSCLQLIKDSKEEDWKTFLEMTLIQPPLDFFKEDPILEELIKNFGAEKRIAIYKTNTNSSYQWHVDRIRNAAINLLLDGFDSVTLFADKPINGMLSNVSSVDYSGNTPVLLNTKKLHTVINFSKVRYLLSIGIPEPASFEDVKKFIENLIVSDKHLQTPIV